MDFILNVLTQGLLYGVLAMGVMLSYKILDFADLSVDGTFPLGGAVCAVMLLNGMNPWLALLGAFVAGCVAGFVTGFLHVKLKIAGLLSGILVMTGLYSINLRIGGSSNIPLYNFETFISPDFLQAQSWMDNAVGQFIIEHYTLLLMILWVVAIKFALDMLLKTRLGYLLKVTGDNEQLVSVLGQNVGWVKIFGLSLSNGLVALSGAMSASIGRYHDVNFGKGMVVLGLASVILGTIVLGRSKFKMTTMVVAGSIIYRLIVAVAIRQGLDSKDMQLVTVVIFIGAILLNKIQIKDKWKKGVSHVSD